MLLTIHNLPANVGYGDVKMLLQEKCNLRELILDNLVSEGTTKRVTVGLANEADAALLVRKVNGLYLGGLQLYVEDRSKSKDSDQPYRSSATVRDNPHYSEPAATLPAGMMQEHGMSGVNPMMMNYNMAGMYMQPIINPSMPYMVYGAGPQAMLAMEQGVPPAAAHDERGYTRFQEEDVRGLDTRKQGRDAFQKRDNNRRPSPKRSNEAFNRTPRWNDKPKPQDVPMRREKSPPRQAWGPREKKQGPRPPFQQPERSAPRSQNKHQPRPKGPQLEAPTSRWDIGPAQHLGPRNEPNQMWVEPNQGWVEPNQGWVEPNQGWVEPNQGWKEPNQEWQEPYQGRQEPNLGWQNPDQNWGEPNQNREEPSQRWEEPNPHWEQGNPPQGEREFNHPNQFKPNDRFNDPSKEFRGEPNFPERQRGPSDDRNRRPQQPNIHPNARKGTNNGDRKDDRFQSAPMNRPDRLHRPEPANFNPNQGNQANERPNFLKRSHSDMRGPDNWNQIANNYPAVKKPKEEFNRRGGMEEPRPKFLPKEQTTIRPFRKPVENRTATAVFVRPEHPMRPEKPRTMTRMINIDQTSRGQATALLAKQAMPRTMADLLLYNTVLKELKQCIRARIDVLLGEELSTKYDEVLTRYRKKYSKKDDQANYLHIRRKCLAERVERLKESNATSVNKDGQAEEKTPGDGSTEAAPETVAFGKQIKQEPKDTPCKIEQNNEKAVETAEKSTTGPNSTVVKKEARGNNRPLTDKQKIQEVKRQRKLEYAKDDLFSLDPVTAKALDEEMDTLNDIFASECEGEAENSTDEMAKKRVTERSLDEFKKVVRLHTTKRLLNIGSGLCVRVFSAGRLPSRAALEEYLSVKGYAVDQLTLKKNRKNTMYVITLDNFKDFDRLNQLENEVIDGTPIQFKSMNLCAPQEKIKQGEIKLKRRHYIRNQIEPFDEPEQEAETMDDLKLEDMVVLDTFNSEDMEDFTINDDDYEKINIGNIKDEDLEDF